MAELTVLFVDSETGDHLAERKLGADRVPRRYDWVRLGRDDERPRRVEWVLWYLDPDEIPEMPDVRVKVR